MSQWSSVQHKGLEEELRNSPLGLAIYGHDQNSLLKTNPFIVETPIIEAPPSKEQSRWSIDTKDSTFSKQQRQSYLTWTTASPDLDLTSLNFRPDHLSATYSPSIQYQTTQPLRISAASSRRSLSPGQEEHATDSPRSTTPQPPQAPVSQDMSTYSMKMDNMTKKTRRPSLTQGLLRSMSSSSRKANDRIPTPDVVPPMPANAAHLAQPAHSPQVRYDLPPSPVSHESDHAAAEADFARRPSLFQLLRKSFSLSPSSSRKGSGSSTVSGSTRKGSGSSYSSKRKNSGNSIAQTFRKLSRDRSQSVSAGERPVDSKTAAHSIIAAARNQHTGSPRVDQSTSSVTKVESDLKPPAARHDLEPFASPYGVPQVQVHHIVELRPDSPSSIGSDSMYELYGDSPVEQQREQPVYQDELKPDAAPHPGGHSPMSLAHSEGPSTAEPSPSTDGGEAEEEGAPMWAGFGSQFNSSFINPWSAVPGEVASPKSSMLMSPGGRRSSTASYASSKRSNLANRMSRSSLSVSHPLHLDDSEESPRAALQNKPRRNSLAANRRSSLAANIASEAESQARNKALRALSGLDQPRSAASTASPTGSSRDKKNRVTGYIDGSLLQPPSSRSSSPSPANQPRKPSLVMPGDPRLLQRRKSSLSVTFAEHSDDGSPTKPPMPISSGYLRHGTYNPVINGSDTSSLSSFTETESDDDHSETSTPDTIEAPGAGPTIAEPFFELRNPWTGYSMKQPHANPAIDQSPSMSPFERRPTLMPSTPKSAKSNSSPTSYFSPQRNRSASIGGSKVPHTGAGMRVSLDLASPH